MRDLLEAAVEKAIEAGASYAEARFSKVFSNRIEVQRGNVERVVPSVEVAGSVRCLVRTWGFASTTQPDLKSMLDAAVRAVKLAKAASSGPCWEVRLAEVPIVEEEVGMGDVVDPRTIPIDEKLEVVLACDEAARAVDDRIAMTQLWYQDLVVLRAFYNSDGAYVAEAYPLTQLRMVITAKEGDNIQSTVGRLSAAAGQEIMAYGDPVGMAERLAKRAIELLSAEKAPSGKARVLVDNSVASLIALCAGLFASAEHAMIAGGELSAFHGKLGQDVASECLNITDDPAAEGLTVSMRYDEEGVKARPVRLIERGKLVSYLYTRSTASAVGQEPNGRARAPSALFTPMPLNTNTIVEPGDRNLEELLEELGDGLYILGLTGASIGRVAHCGCEEAYEVKGGELKRRFRSVSIDLDFTKDLKEIEAVGSDFDVIPLTLSTGGRSYPVCGGAPHLLFSELPVR